MVIISGVPIFRIFTVMLSITEHFVQGGWEEVLKNELPNALPAYRNEIHMHDKDMICSQLTQTLVLQIIS